MRRMQYGSTAKVVIAGAILSTTFLFIGCGNKTDEGAPPRTEATSASPTADVGAMGGGGGGNEAQHYDTLSDAVNDPKNVGLLGSITDVRVSRVMNEEASAGLIMIGATLHVDDKISGRTLDTIGTDITVEFIGSSRVPDIPDQESKVVAEYKQQLDELGQAVWIVRSKGGSESAYYRLASSQCLFTEQDGTVVNPGYVGSSDPMVSSAEKYTSLSDLADAMRAADRSQ